MHIPHRQKKDAELNASNLSEDQKFLVAHATRSYFGSLNGFLKKGKALWLVNEGEYLMINTLDLTVNGFFRAKV